MQGRAERLRPDCFRCGLLYFRQAQGEQSRQTVADDRKKACKGIIVLYQHRKHAGGHQKAYHAHTVINAKSLLAVLSLAR